jgi:predicted nuclease of predicted toxin-antitoxin system
MAFFVADESIDRQIVEALRKTHHVTYIAEEQAGLTDEEVLSFCNTTHAFLLTADKDFGDLIFRQGWNHHGVLLLRLAGLSADKKVELCIKVINAHLVEMRGNFTVVTKKTMRIRKPHGA